MKKNSPLAPSAPKINATKKPKAKNLSPAKKFRLRLRRAKFQKQQQAKDDYFEHDNREIARAVAVGEQKKAGRLYKKGRRAQMYIDAYLKSQRFNQNGDTASPDETQDSSNGHDVSVKSTVGLPSMTSHFGRAFGKEQAAHNARLANSASSLAGNISTVKCCCHCACVGAKRKARRKLSSPYFGDFTRTISLANGGCARKAAQVTTKILNKTTTTTHHETLVKSRAGEFVNYRKVTLNHQMLPVFGKSYNLQGRADSGGGCGVREMRSVVRFVIKFFHIIPSRKSWWIPLSGWEMRTSHGNEVFSCFSFPHERWRLHDWCFIKEKFLFHNS